MQGMRSNVSFPNGIRVKSRKFVGSECSPAPSAVKNNLPVMLVILIFILLVLFFNVNFTNKSIILHKTHVKFFASTLLALYLFVVHPCFFFFHQVVRKPLKFINNVLQTNESFLNVSKYHSFLSLCTLILSHRLRRCSNSFCIDINIFSYLVRNDTAKI